MASGGRGGGGDGGGDGRRRGRGRGRVRGGSERGSGGGREEKEGFVQHILYTCIYLHIPCIPLYTFIHLQMPSYTFIYLYTRSSLYRGTPLYRYPYIGNLLYRDTTCGPGSSLPQPPSLAMRPLTASSMSMGIDLLSPPVWSWLWLGLCGDSHHSVVVEAAGLLFIVLLMNTAMKKL